MGKAKRGGFTIIELLLVVGIMMMLGVVELAKMKGASDDALAERAGKEFGATVDALAAYLRKHMADLQNMQTLPAGTCVSYPDANTCELNLTALTREGMAPMGWEPRNRAIRTGYTAYVKRFAPAVAPSGGTTFNDYNVEAMIRTNDGWTRGSGIEWVLLGSAVRYAGPSSGVARGAMVNGLFGSFSMPTARYPGVADGQLVGVSKLQASALGQYVRRDGSLAMTGDLNMGNYRVNNANDMQLLGQDTLLRTRGSVAPMVSSLAPKFVLKGVYGVADFDSDNQMGSVARPVCPDAESGGSGVPRILVTMTSLYNEMQGGMESGTPIVTPMPPDSQAVQIGLKKQSTAAFGGWNFYALEDVSPTANIWRVYVRRYYDGGYIPGEALAQVYCYYP